MRHGGDSVRLPGGGDREMSPAAWRQRVHEWEAATPPSRDRFMDATRVLSMLVVVAGHWLMAAVAVVDGRVSTRNILDVVPTLQPATWALQVMPLFFLAGGFSNAVAWRRRASAGVAAFVGTRLARLTRPALVFTVGAAAILTAGRALGAPSEQIALAGRFVGAPLWFLAIYLLVAAATPVLLRWHERAAMAVPAGLCAAVIVVDVLRMGEIVDVGFANFILVWLLVHQLGFWYADGWTERMSHGGAWACVAGALGVLVLLTGPGPYPVSMIGLEGQMSNMAPPSVCLLLVTIGQAGALVLVRPAACRWLRRPLPWAVVAGLGARAMTIYVWHVSVLVVVSAALVALEAGLPQPESALWWVTRPGWLAVLALVLALMVALLGRCEQEAPAKVRCTPAATWLGVASASGGLSIVALGGAAAPTVWAGIGALLGGRILVRTSNGEVASQVRGS